MAEDNVGNVGVPGLGFELSKDAPSTVLTAPHRIENGQLQFWEQVPFGSAHGFCDGLAGLGKHPFPLKRPLPGKGRHFWYAHWTSRQLGFGGLNHSDREPDRSQHRLELSGRVYGSLERGC